MEDPGILIAVLKTGLLLVMVGGAIAVFRELVPMARGRVIRHSQPEEKREG